MVILLATQFVEWWEGEVKRAAGYWTSCKKAWFMSKKRAFDSLRKSLQKRWEFYQKNIAKLEGMYSGVDSVKDVPSSWIAQMSMEKERYREKYHSRYLREVEQLCKLTRKRLFKLWKMYRKRSLRYFDSFFDNMEKRFKTAYPKNLAGFTAFGAVSLPGEEEFRLYLESMTSSLRSCEGMDEDLVRDFIKEERRRGLDAIKSWRKKLISEIKRFWEFQLSDLTLELDAIEMEWRSK